MHDDVTLPSLERVLQDILKGLESCVVPDDWSLPVPVPVPVPDVLHHNISATSSETTASTVSCLDPTNADDTVLSHITSLVQPSDRRSSRFEAQIKAKPNAKAEIGTGTETGTVESPLMRRLAEDFMYVPTKIPDYR